MMVTRRKCRVIIPCIKILVGVIFVLMGANSVGNYTRQNKDSYNIRVSKVHVLAYMRSGSTFTADIFKAHPNAFYMFEPFQGDRKDSEYRTTDGIHRVARIVKNILNCEFSNVPYKILTSASYSDLPRTFNKGFGTFNKCIRLGNRSKSMHTPMQLQSSYSQCIQLLKTACENARVRIVKTIRIEMRASLQIYQLDKEVKTILLVRDPRPMFLSREVRKLQPSWNDEDEPRRTCSEMVENAKLALLLPHSAVYLLRYEDLSLRPIAIATALYNFAKLLPVPENVALWVRESTNAPQGSEKYRAYGTGRFSSATNVLKWTKGYKNFFPLMMKTQDACTDMFKVYGYRKFKTLFELTDYKKVPITNPSNTWFYASMM